MEIFNTGGGYKVSHLVDNYPWAKFGDGTVVDVSVLNGQDGTLSLIDTQVGGGSGVCQRAIMEAFPSLRVAVQDIEMNEAMKVDNKDANLELIPHDFFTPQTVVADV